MAISCVSSLKIVKKWPQNIYFSTNFDLDMKNAYFGADFESVEKVAKSLHKESWELLHKVLIGEKVCFYYTFMLKPFYTFLKNLKSDQILRFLHPHRNYYLALLANFVAYRAQTAKKIFF